MLEFFNSLTIRKKLIFFITILVLFTATTITITFLTLDKQKSDGVIINLAGKQRMLSQKMTKEALLMLTSNFDKKNIEETIKLFDITLTGLINGNTDLNLPKNDNEEFVNSIKEVGILWQNFKVALERLIIINKESMEYESTFNIVKDSNTELLKKMKFFNSIHDLLYNIYEINFKIAVIM